MATRSKARKAVIVGGVVVGVVVIAWVALFGYWYVVDSRNPYGGHNSYGMRDYTPERQEKAAHGIVAGLNTGSPDSVRLARYDGYPVLEAVNALIRANVTAVLPAPGCRYVLDGIEDKGEQERPAELVPWYANAVDHAWGFDMATDTTHHPGHCHTRNCWLLDRSSPPIRDIGEESRAADSLLSTEISTATTELAHLPVLQLDLLEFDSDR
jgi:hypothetical protein